MTITALCIVSASEINLAKPGFTYYWADNNPDDFNDILFNFGMDLTQPIEKQTDIQHKNRMNKVVICDRYIGYERTDKDWINSGYASKEAKDKASGSKLLADLYKHKGYPE